MESEYEGPDQADQPDHLQAQTACNSNPNQTSKGVGLENNQSAQFMKELGLADIDMHALDEDFEFKDSQQESSSGRKQEEYPFSENELKNAAISVD